MTSTPDDVGPVARRMTLTDPPPRPEAAAGAGTDGSVGYLPILDVARGTAAGYQAVPMPGASTDDDRALRATRLLRTALSAHGSLPTNTFISIPVPLDLVGDAAVLAALRDHGDLAGIILDITDFSPDVVGSVDPALDEHRSRGARISVGGRDTAQPELGSIIRLRPSIVRLGRAWVSGLDESAAKRAAIEVTGRLAAQLDAWILAETVGTAAELRTLSELGVPLAQGPFIGDARSVWPEIRLPARTALPTWTSASDGVLRSLVQQAYTTRNLAAARSVLPDASGFETVVVIDDADHPVSLLERGTFGRWEAADIMTVNIDTPAADAVARAMARPRAVRFLPLVCTDAAGRFVGILRIEDLVAHLSALGAG
ncbi:EAL domain-containing protein [Aeromicrobium stalagmiti]|uniref:EAL domain-containing protein n=1 Tax=Aeromicrobium stalagmiti TaxID=2738988 RepID=UPI001568AF91|nr:EAL domain-containing protein [Aeromicrobium stalagmiti]NRQ50059.1 EAL domain-containing protein [Aeromicrobium stalagmiti]